MNARAEGKTLPSARPDRRPRDPVQGPGASPLRVAVTRPAEGRRAQGSPSPDRLARLLRSRGAQPVLHPLQERLPPEDPAPLRAALSGLLMAAHGIPTRKPNRHWLLVTAPTAVPAILRALQELSASADALRQAGVRVAAVGTSTGQALSEAGLPPDLIPERFTGDDLLVALVETLAPGAGDEAVPPADSLAAGSPLAGYHFVLPRAAVARDVLPKGLRGLGARVEVVTAYRIVERPGAGVGLVEAIHGGEVDVVALTSGSAARILGAAWRGLPSDRRPDADLGRDLEEGQDGGLEADPTWPPSVAMAVIGPVTARAARRAGLPVDLVPEASTLAALAQVIVQEGGS